MVLGSRVRYILRRGIMYARTIVDGVGVWDSHRKSHRQGKIPNEGTLLEVLSEVGGWYEIVRPPLDRDVDAGYPAFWVRVQDTVKAEPLDPPPGPEPVEDDVVTYAFEQLAGSLYLILKWFKG